MHQGYILFTLYPRRALSTVAGKCVKHHRGNGSNHSSCQAAYAEINAEPALCKQQLARPSRTRLCATCVRNVATPKAAHIKLVVPNVLRCRSQYLCPRNKHKPRSQLLGNAAETSLTRRRCAIGPQNCQQSKTHVFSPKKRQEQSISYAA